MQHDGVLRRANGGDRMTELSDVDFAAARHLMVDGQLRPNKVTDPRLVSALRTLPREQFLPAGRRHLAYGDEDVALDGLASEPGRVMVAPLVIARLLQAAAARPGERALVVGAGTGYGAAVLAAMGLQVTALESDPALVTFAQAAIAASGQSVSLVRGPLAEGWAAGAPYNLVVIEGAVAAIPLALGEQLAAAAPGGGGGRLLAVVGAEGDVTRAMIAEKSAAGLRSVPLFDCPTRHLAAMSPEPAFVF